MAEPSRTTYCEAIWQAMHYLLRSDPRFLVIGQGLWSPWYVGNSMKNLDVEFGRDRIIDSPVSEAACTGAALGAALCGYRSMVVHPRVDFMLLAIDQIVTQAANWSHMFGGQASPAVTLRAIMNRGGEQGAQHSQSLHAWFAHVPGLHVVMPYSVQDARDLLIASVLSDGPVVFIDDRWLYETSDELPPLSRMSLADQGPKILAQGKDITLVGSSYCTHLCVQAGYKLREAGISAEIIDLRVLNPLKLEVIVQSVNNTGRLCVVDGGWAACGLASEVITGVIEKISPSKLKSSPVRVTLPNAPAPTSRALEDLYYPTIEQVLKASLKMFSDT